ncbi:MAG: hypothetical protein HC835_12400 [Oscillatoriales cyanobacterium RM2_1_1]|nr:hypothetical protein [Oscillatoriales cyanobacterium SM2_3_0]NJO46357.1 hypothetical protein [Oscillatoriales cyanobacterium RM2_1_1]
MSISDQKLQLVLPNPSLEALKIALLKAETVGELAALIINHTHEEILHTYSQLPRNQQIKIQVLWSDY